MAKVLAIIGSPRKCGTSNFLADSFLRGAADNKCEIEKIQVSEAHLKPCSGCEHCQTSGGVCVFDDDSGIILQKMIDADVIAFFSPIYFYMVPAQLKVLIDRSFARYTEIRNKKVYVFLTGVDTNPEKYDTARREFVSYVSVLPESSIVDELIAMGFAGSLDPRGKEIAARAYDMGKEIRITHDRPF